MIFKVMKIFNTVFVLLFATFSACNFIGQGTLGGFGEIVFPTSKKRLDQAIDSFYGDFPEYKVPEKWSDLDNWSARGYDFLKSNIFYFKDDPEEMYYVTYIGEQKALEDTTEIRIAIRAVNVGRRPWLLHKDLSDFERARISKRFNDDIVAKLNGYLHLGDDGKGHKPR